MVDEQQAPILVRIERRDAVGVVTMNQPERLNPLSTWRDGSEQQVAEAIIELERDDEIKVIVVTGAGRAFSAGADLAPPPDQQAVAAASVASSGPDRQLLRAIVESTDTDESRGWAMWYTLNRCSKPLIAAVHGWAVGGGAEVAFWCDMIVADETARFSLPEVEMGLLPPFAIPFLTRSIGRWKAAELIYTGRPFDAAEADRLGLVTKVVPAGTDVEAAIELGQSISRFSLAALSATRRALMRSILHTDEWELNRRDFVLAGQAKDRGEAAATYRQRVMHK
jgi:enoyl-CoA hydratase